MRRRALAVRRLHRHGGTPRGVVRGPLPAVPSRDGASLPPLQVGGGGVTYADFLDRKAQLGGWYGFEGDLTSWLYPFQSELVDWALRKGRAAIFADCGLGKTPMQLAWADNVRRHTGKPVLIVTPLAVTSQTIAEAHKFGIDAALSRDGTVAGDITVTNYERLHHFDRTAFGGAVCDESSAIKSFDGERRKLVTDFMLKMPYRLLCTATAAPNDYTELGTSAEALGELGYMDMLARFFKNDQNNSIKPLLFLDRGGPFQKEYDKVKWRFKGHAEAPFWKWVSSWARAIRKPSDYGYDDGDFILPPLIHHQHMV